jgi:hypothetical protein
MTMRPMNHFKCDRCGDEAYVAMANSPPTVRNLPPEGWVMLRTGDDPSQPAQHLCPPCSFGLTGYLEGGSARPSERA